MLLSNISLLVLENCITVTLNDGELLEQPSHICKNISEVSDYIDSLSDIQTIDAQYDLILKSKSGVHKTLTLTRKRGLIDLQVMLHLST